MFIQLKPLALGRLSERQHQSCPDKRFEQRIGGHLDWRNMLRPLAGVLLTCLIAEKKKL